MVPNMMSASGITFDPSTMLPQLTTHMGQLQLAGAPVEPVLQPSADLRNIDQ